MGLPFPKTPLIGILSQILAFIFGILCFIPGQNGVLEGAYLVSLNTSKYGHNALQSSNMFYLNNSNPLYAVATSLHPDLQNYEPPPAVKGLNDAIMKRIEVNMSDPKTAKGVYDTPLRDVISGGKDLINGEEGRWKIANGMADFVNGMAMEMSKKGSQQSNTAATPPVVGTPHARARRAASGPASLARAAAPLQARGPSQSTSSSPTTPNILNRDAAGLTRRGDDPAVQCPAGCVPASTQSSKEHKDDGNPYGSPKPKIIIPPTGPWTPIKNAIKVQGPIISNGIRHGAVKEMNEQTDTLRKAVPIYDFYNIYNVGYCWGFYRHKGPQTVGCASSADWRNVDIAPRIEALANELISPEVKIEGPIGLGPNVEQVLKISRILLLLMYINKVMTVVNQAFAMAIPLLGVAAILGGILPSRLHLKLSFVNFAASLAASVAVVGGTISVLGMMLGMGLTMPPMNAIMSIEMKLGVPYVFLCLVDSVFAVVGTVCWWKTWRMMKNGAKQQAEQESQQEEKVEVVTVHPNKKYDPS
ncbi:hypothetical protein FKW77_002149 [Venturia effusa]|uniref:Uncharacterized protein n=1 Tax=Venturia effusa TaxID=50376 RepID=A0A517L8R4_9PEZI|nr:hypothetical protein FKW77_002149 [Venturia effusa]